MENVSQEGTLSNAVPSKLSTLGAAFQLVRPLNLLFSAMGVVVGAVLASGFGFLNEDPGTSLFIAMLSAAAITAAANAVNDVFDVTIDSVNRPDRPSPSGRISRRGGHAVWITAAATGVGLSLFLKPAHVVLALGSTAVVFGYSYRLKRHGVVGNLVVALMVSLTLIYGGLTTDSAGMVWVGCAAAFLLTLAREIVKDLEDMEGDVAHGIGSLPARIGERPTRRLTAALLVIVLCLAPIPYTHLGFSGVYLFLVLIASLLFLATLWILSSESARPGDYSRSSALLKAAMAVGMVGLLFA